MTKHGDTVEVKAPSRLVITLTCLLCTGGGAVLGRLPTTMQHYSDNTVMAQSPDANQAVHDSLQRQVDAIQKRFDTLEVKIDTLLQRSK